MKKFLFGILGLLFAAPAVADTLPAGYTELEYIEGTGTQYITTDVIANQNTSAEIKFVPTSVYKSNGVFGARTSKTSNAFNIWEPGTEGVIIANYNNKGAVLSNVTSVLNETYVVYLSSTRFSVNNNTVSISNTESFSTPGGLQLFNIYGGNCSTTTSSVDGNRIFSGKVYYFKVWQGDSLTLNLIPAKNSSGVVGMYDTVSGNFFTNAGTGTFTAGPVACPGGTLQTYTSATGTVTQNGTPTPTNPIEPIFYQQGDMVLRKVGDIADSYDATTGKITRRVGVKVLNGTENWIAHTTNGVFYVAGFFPYDIPNQAINPVSTHYTGVPRTTAISEMPNKSIKTGTASNPNFVLIKDTGIADVNSLISFLSQNLVTVWYPLPESAYYTEDWAVEQCTSSSSSSPIKIATTAYNSARFSPVVTELNDTIATIRSVVTNTINQTKAIADLQATKQTRPDETCPAGKKCLLVEDDAGQPHWYEIIESAD